MTEVYYHRPGKELSIYQEDVISQDENRLVTFKTLSPAVAAVIAESMERQALSAPHQRPHTIYKVYHFHEWFNVLEFRDQTGTLIGYYSDIATPLEPFGEDFAMTDLFLDIWVYPNGRLLELDWDEFEQAIQQQLITPAQAEMAQKTMQRLKDEAAHGIYPKKYLD